MKQLLLITISTLIFAQDQLIEGLERGSAVHKKEACSIAKEEARKKYDVQDMNVGCNCEKSDSRLWMCFVKFKYLPKAKEE